MAAVATSAAWLGLAVLIISIDQGRLSVDESRTSTEALVGLVLAFLLMVTVGMVNIRRARCARGPIGRSNLVKQ